MSGAPLWVEEFFVDTNGEQCPKQLLAQKRYVNLLARPSNDMKYKDLREFIAKLEQNGQLKRVSIEVDPYLEMTEICDRALRTGGPAILFENPKGHTIPVLGNLFGTPQRVAMGMGRGRRGSPARGG